MEREKILGDVEEALKFVLCRDDKAENVQFLRNAIVRFVADELIKYSDRELEEAFVEPEGSKSLENAVNAFRAYLESLRDLMKAQATAKDTK